MSTRTLPLHVRAQGGRTVLKRATHGAARGKAGPDPQHTAGGAPGAL
jgi:hypothetical protein